MKKEYDFSKSKPNPYIKKLKKQITIRISNEAIDYFKGQAEATGISYQQLIDLYLTDCVTKKRKLKMRWG